MDDEPGGPGCVRRVVLAFNDAITRQNLTSLSQLMTDDHAFIDSDDNVLHGRELVLDAWSGFFDAFPDYRNVWTSLISADDLLIAIGRSVCASEPRLDGPAIWTAKTCGGRVAEWRVSDDTPENRARLGVGPTEGKSPCPPSSPDFPEVGVAARRARPQGKPSGVRVTHPRRQPPPQRGRPVSPAVTADDTGEASSLAAAQAVARQHGVACDEAVRIAAGSNVLVHLKPAPVVARVMTATAVLHDDAEQWLAREVAVGAFVAERSHLVVAPTDILPPGPHLQDGLWMTLWKFVPHDAQAPPPEPRQLGCSLRRLHAVLADYPGDLAPLSETRDWLERLLDELRPSPSLTQQDIRWLRSELDALTPAVFESSLPAQALHGDASMSNLLRTESGPVWIDLEDVCAGPVAWDIAGLVTSARARGQSAKFIEELLAAYGEPGVEDLEAFLEAHALYEVVWQAFEARRRPRAMKRAAASLARWRERRAG